jgi:hypothetical protein
MSAVYCVYGLGPHAPIGDTYVFLINSSFLVLFVLVPCSAAARERQRYLSILEDICATHQPVKLLKSAMLDLMTLKCPNCKTPVDPLPDACSAVMCLSCGGYYCNYCFEGFSTGMSGKFRISSFLRYIMPISQCFSSLHIALLPC